MKEYSWALHSGPFPLGHRPLLLAGFSSSPWQQRPRAQSLDLFSWSALRLRSLNTNSPLMSISFISTAWTTRLNSRLIYPTAYTSSLLGCLVGISNLTCPKDNSWSSLTDLLLSQSSSHSLLKWRFDPFSYSGQKSWSDLRFFYFSHTHIQSLNIDCCFKTYT